MLTYAVTKLGYYNPWLFMGSAVMSIGGGVLTLLQVDSGISKWIGYQVIFGSGAGASMPMVVPLSSSLTSPRKFPISFLILL